MSKFTRKIQRRILGVRIDRKGEAEKKVFRILEERWADELRGQPIPERHRSVMRKDPLFQALVGQVVQHGQIALPDLDVTPVETRRADGTYESLMHRELAGDPRRYFCSDCGDTEVDRGGERCADCAHLYPEE